MAKKFVNPEQLYDGSPFGLSQAVVDTDSSLVFVSGQVDWNRQYQVSQNSVPGQFEAALEHLRTALVAAGAEMQAIGVYAAAVDSGDVRLEPVRARSGRR